MVNIFDLNLAWKPCCSFSIFSTVCVHRDFSNVFNSILTHHILNFNQGVNLWFHGLILQEVSNINWHFKRWCELTSLMDWRFLFPLRGEVFCFLTEKIQGLLCMLGLLWFCWAIGGNEELASLACATEKAVAPHSNTLAWKIPWAEEPGGLQSMGSLRVGHDWATFTFHFHALDKEVATPSSVLAWRVPGMGEPGGLPSMGSHRVRHDWRDLAAAAACARPRSSVFLCLDCSSLTLGERTWGAHVTGSLLADLT